MRIRAKALAATFFALASVPSAMVIFVTPDVANADVCVNAGRRVSVSGCADLSDVMAPYVPPPAYYAPLPGDPPPPEDVPPPPPPPPPPPNVSVCANVGRRVSVSGCV